MLLVILKCVSNIFNFLKKNEKNLQLNKRQLHDIELSVEEIFTNMIRHNTNSTQSINISVESADRKFVACLTDHEAQPFDITQTTNIDIDNYLDEKRSGGFGIFLVKQLMDEVIFEHLRGISKVTIIKHI